MSQNGQERLFEGWLTKSPPIKRVWRGRWRRRWFSLQQSGDLPGQFVLIYYTDRKCRKMKGVIDLDHCEQVDTGLKFEDKKVQFDHMFDIKTPSRTYYLAADSEQEMKTWVKYICSVCGLKATSDEEDVNILQGIENNVEATEVPLNETISTNNLQRNPPVSPVSTSPYIPISECISGSSPFISAHGIRDYQALLKHNMKNSFFRTNNYNNDTYETAPPPTYLNFTSPLQYSKSYDIPRLLQAPPNGRNTSKINEEINYQNLNPSPLQSPSDTESVFTDDDWSHNTTTQSEKSHLPKVSESSSYGEGSITQKFSKLSVDGTKLIETQNAAPPRPPKPSHIQGTHFNFPPTNKGTKLKTEQKNSITSEEGSVLLGTLDEMYDFPRPLHNESELCKTNKRHCYNNAAPVSLDGQIFRYDISPKPGTSGTQMFKYDEENLEEPASPMSHSSSTHAYSNLPSPLLPDTQLMPPPVVNRGLKPKRKLSDSLSISSNPEQPSPRLAPSVDRNLKPTMNLLPAKHEQKSFDSENEYSNGKQYLIQDSNNLSLHRSCESILHDNGQMFNFVNHQKLEYLDLDLDVTSQLTEATVAQPARSPEANTVYKKVDFMKTIAFNITKNNLEKERNETGNILKK